MISLIICSRTGFLSAALTADIAATIGVPYEIIVIDNAENRYNIFEAYNIGVSQSRYPILCFMHDDIEYHTENWGQNVLAHFADQQTGAIGIAGSPYVPAMPGSWWGGGVVNQHLLVNENGKLAVADKLADNVPAAKKPVITLDGVWMCIRKDLFTKISFDGAAYKGFHFYDTDIALQVFSVGYHIYCVYDISIYHFSNGKMDKSWCENAMIFNRKWKSALPLSCVKLDFTQRKNAELKTLNEFIAVLTENGTPEKKVYQLALRRVISAPSGYLYYKTPAFFAIYLGRYLKSAFKAA